MAFARYAVAADVSVYDADTVSSHGRQALPCSSEAARPQLTPSFFCRLDDDVRAFVKTGQDQFQFARIRIDITDGEDAGHVGLERGGLHRNQVVLQMDAPVRHRPELHGQAEERQHGVAIDTGGDVVAALEQGARQLAALAFQRRDLFAYIKTLPAASGKAPPHAVPFPFNVRRSLGVWKALFMDGKPFVADPGRSPAWNRGAYLVNALGHCAECHSPRKALGGIITAQRFAGGPNPDGEGWVPNITQKGLADWSEKDIAYFLETGQTPDGDTAGGSMARVIRNTSQLSGEDRAAMAVYLKSLAPVDGPKRPAKKGWVLARCSRAWTTAKPCRICGFRGPPHVIVWRNIPAAAFPLIPALRSHEHPQSRVAEDCQHHGVCPDG
eukprot:gene31948-42625_t